MLEENQTQANEHPEDLSAEEEGIEEAGEAIGVEQPIAEETEVAPEESEETEAERELRRARQEAKENYDKIVRVYADFENYKKRMEKEKTEFIKYANEGLIKDFLGVVDNLERAVEQAGQGAEAQGLVEGVEMILKQIKDLLEKHGAKEIQALGKPFDPNLHEAMMHEVSDEHDENTVIDELQKGYLMKDRLLRPSMVKVSKKAEEAADVGHNDEE